MISFNIETLNSGANLPLKTLIIKFDIGRGGLNVLSYVPMYLCEITGEK